MLHLSYLVCMPLYKCRTKLTQISYPEKAAKLQTKGNKNGTKLAVNHAQSTTMPNNYPFSKCQIADVTIKKVMAKVLIAVVNLEQNCTGFMHIFLLKQQLYTSTIITCQYPEARSINLASGY